MAVPSATSVVRLSAVISSSYTMNACSTRHAAFMPALQMSGLARDGSNFHGRKYSLLLSGVGRALEHPPEPALRFETGEEPYI